MKPAILKLFLRLALSAGFLSAVADRFGLWGKDNSVWGNWDNFVRYTELLNPWLPSSLISPAAMMATAAEIIFPICLLIGFKTELFAKLSRYLLLLFAFAMMISTSIKGVFDYSILTAAGAAFALGQIRQKYFEVDIYIK